MDFSYSAKAEEYRERVAAFMAAHIYPNEKKLLAQIATGDRWQPVPLMEELKDKAKAAGLWNLFFPQWVDFHPSVIHNCEGDRIRR